LPVASRLAPCRHSEILYPSHPLKPQPARRAHRAAHLCPGLAICARLSYPFVISFIFSHFSPSSLSLPLSLSRAVCLSSLAILSVSLGYASTCRIMNQMRGDLSETLSRVTRRCGRVNARRGTVEVSRDFQRARIITVSSREGSFRDFAETETLEELETCAGRFSGSMAHGRPELGHFAADSGRRARKIFRIRAKDVKLEQLVT